MAENLRGHEKHSFARLESNVAKIVRVLSEHGKPIDEGMGYAVLPEFWEWFHAHLFAYHVTSHDVLTAAYAFHVPGDIVAPIGRTMFWGLMNLWRGRDPISEVLGHKVA